MDLGGDGHLGEKGPVPRDRRWTTVTALDVFDDVEDLLTLPLPGRPPDVQDGRHMLLPEQRQKDSQAYFYRTDEMIRQTFLLSLFNGNLSLLLG